MYGNKHIYFLFLLIFVAFNSFGQQKTKTQLQKERNESLKKIELASQTLKQTSTKKKASVGQLNALKYQISIRQNVIKSIEEEINLLTAEIEDNLSVVASLEDDLAGLKREYSAMVYAAYKARNGQDKLTFLFSSESFNQLLRRMAYMKQYAKARQKQVKQILAMQQTLLDENTSVEIKKNDKRLLLNNQISEKTALASMRKEQEAILTDLQKEEKLIKKDLARKRASLKVLDKTISDLIKREVEEAAKAASLTETKAVAILSKDFSENKLKLPWPTTGFVSQKFGLSRHPVLKLVEINSRGIKIQTSPTADATSVFKGEVRSVVLIPGFGKAVLVKHGDYFTLYAKLSEVYVQKGQTVNVGDKIGKIFTENDGITELYFELWHDVKQLNPEGWLIKI